ncbi:hypothetical protein ACHAQH_003118 [Verticillium albo-atrum]
MHLQPIDNATDMEPFVNDVPQHIHIPDEGGEGDTFDDVWGSAPSSPTTQTQNASSSSAAHHPSDMPRLQAEHTTAGYREGVTAAKAHSIQAGFDEGFSLGAAIGSKAGQLIGLLEGISHALVGQGDGSLADAAARRLKDARDELQIESLFGPDYWNTDGTWKYEVVADNASQGNQHGDDDGILFADVADAHPLIVKWTEVVEAAIAKWGINRAVFADVGEEERLAAQERGASNTGPQQTKKPLDW